MSHLKREYSLLIGDHRAERMKIEIGSACPLPGKKPMAVKGRDIVSGIPRTIFIDDAEIREALQDCISTIVTAVRLALEHTPPELAGDLIDHGIVLTGGGSLLQGLHGRLRDETALPIVTVDDPQSSVVLGLGKPLEELSLLRNVSTHSSLHP